jgi:large conductance mechanosensitive channel
MPLIGLALRGTDFAAKFVALDGGNYATIEEATEAGAAILTYGNFISVILDFIIVAFVIFCMIKVINTVRAKAAKEEAEAPAPAPTTKVCPFCKSEIAIDATKCPHCTSDVE